MKVLIEVFAQNWSGNVRLSRVPCVREKVRLHVPPHVAFGVHVVEYTVADFAHCENSNEDEPVAIIWVE